MSVEAMTWVFRQDMSPAPKMVLIAMADNADDLGGNCWPSQKLIARKASVDVRTVRRHVKWLEEHGLIERKKRYFECSCSGECEGRAPHTHRSSDAYQLRMDRIYYQGQVYELTWETWSAIAADRTPEPRFAIRVPIEDILSPMGEDAGAQGVADNLSPMGKTVEISQNGDSGQNVPYGGEGDSHTGQKQRPYRTGVSAIPIRNIEPPIEPPDLTRPKESTDVAREDASGQVGLGTIEEHIHDLDDEAQVPATTLGAQDPQGAALGEDEKALIATCLPQALQALDAQGAKQVAALLAERIQAGWQPSQIRAAIGDRGLDGTRRLSSIVAYRLRENVRIDMAPARLTQQAEDLDRKRRQARLEAENHEDEEETPEEQHLWEKITRDNPNATRRELAELFTRKRLEAARATFIG